MSRKSANPMIDGSNNDSSVEYLDSEHFEKHIENTTQNAPKSLFNLSLEYEGNSEKTAEYKNYEMRLIEEMKNWKDLFYEAYQNKKKSVEPQPIIDKSILPPDKLDYLNQAVCLQTFLRDSIQFRKEAKVFMDYYCAQNKEIIENLGNVCEQRLNVIKANILDEMTIVRKPDYKNA